MPASHETIAGQWDNYREAVIPKDAPPVQLTECQKSFYAGAHSLLQLILQCLDRDEEVTEHDLALLENLENELESFCLMQLANHLGQFPKRKFRSN